MCGNKRWMGFVRFAMILLVLSIAAPIMAQARRPQQQADPCAGLEGDARRSCLTARLQELQAQQQQQQAAASRPTGDLAPIIARFEQVLAGQNCDGGRNRGDRCSDALFQLGDLYFNKARDDFAAALEAYDVARRNWERTQRGTRPTPPIPDYSQSLRAYWRLTREYPTFARLPDAFTRMSNIYLQAGHIDTARVIMQQLIQRFPASPRVSTAHFNLANFAFDENRYPLAYEHLRQVRQDQVDPMSWEMTHFRKGNVKYNIGDYDEAVQYFFSYIDACDKGIYARKQFRAEALEFLASSFSDMPNGANEAIKFFAKNPGRAYEVDIVYRVGAKNWERNQWEAAILALETAVDRFPNYKDAPQALQMLIHSYMMRREFAKANEIRERLVDNYGPGSAWHRANAGDRVALELAEAEMRRALGDIAVFYHRQANSSRERAHYDQALRRYTQFFERFPNDKWRVYQFNFYIAEVYSHLGDFDKAAFHYNFVAMEDLAKYPAYMDALDTAGMAPEEIERLRAAQGERTNPLDEISQEDAGNNAIVMLNNARKREMEREEIEESDGLRAYALPHTKRLIDQIMAFYRRFPQSNDAPGVLGMAGDIHFAGQNYPAAIEAYKLVVDNFPNAENHRAATLALGNAYSRNNQFDLAMQIFERLLAASPEGSDEWIEAMDYAAGAMYRHAEHIKSRGDMDGAVAAFKAIYGRFPRSRIAEPGWREAGIIYEEGERFELAGQTFLELAMQFPGSENREAAFMRSAENYKKAVMHEKVAEVYLTAANTITRAEFAIPALSAASEAYQTLGQYDKAGEMFTLIFQRYRDDPQTPLALYNAGLVFEKGRHFHQAIQVYQLLAENFPRSEYAAEGFFSIGLCWEKLEEFENMATTFEEYARRFDGDKFKQVMAYVKAGNAFFRMENFERAERNYGEAIKVYERFSSTHDIDVANVAEAYFRMGEMAHRRFANISLQVDVPENPTARQVSTALQAMQRQMRDKMAAVEVPATHFIKAIELGVEEWTMRATHMIGQTFYDMAYAVSNQTLLGTNDIERMGSRIQILRGLDPFYERAMGMFGQNITWAKEQNLSGEYIDMSKQGLMEMAFRRGFIIEEVGQILRDAPLPDLDEEDMEYYMMEIEDQFNNFRMAAAGLYVAGLQMAQEVGIANSQWIDSIRTRLKELNDFFNIDEYAEALALELVEWVPEVKRDEHGNIIEERPRDFEFERNMRRIQSIMGMSIPVDEKIRQLNSIRMQAERNILIEREAVNRLKAAAGS